MWIALQRNYTSSRYVYFTSFNSALSCSLSVFHFMPGFYFRWCRWEAVFFICLCRPCLAQCWGGMNNKPSISRNWFARIENQVQISSSCVKILELILFCTQRDFHAINKKQITVEEEVKKWRLSWNAKACTYPISSL